MTLRAYLRAEGEHPDPERRGLMDEEAHSPAQDGRATQGNDVFKNTGGRKHDEPTRFRPPLE